MKSKLYKLICFLLLAITAPAMNEQQISFQKLPIRESLPNATVKRIFQDSKGFIWLGTESGICRYDGYKLQIFKSNIDFPDLLTSGNILCMAEDKDQRIWFGTDRGVNVLDHNNQVLPLVIDEKIQNLRINSILSDRNNNIWIGSEDGLFVYNYGQKSIKAYYHNQGQTNTLPGNNINHIMEDMHGNIWIAIWEEGLCRFHPESDSFISLPPIGRNNNPFVMVMDSDEILWVGAWAEGIFKVDLRVKDAAPTYQQFLPDIHKPVDFQNSVFSIMHDTIADRIWMLTPKGLSIITDRNEVKFEHINALDLFKDASNVLNQIIKDRQGNIWIATTNDGVYLANLNRSLFYSNTLDELKNKHGFMNVHSFYEYEDEIWVGLGSHGITVIDKGTGRVKKNSDIRKIFDQYKKLSFSTIRTIVKHEADGSVWLGGNNILLKVLRKGNQWVLTDVADEVNDPTKLKTNNISALLSDSKKRMWIATRQGLVLYNKSELQNISALFNNANVIMEEQPGVFWVGSPSKGILRIVEKPGNKFETSQYNMDNQKINSNEINAIIRDNQGQLWVGTNNGGLNQYDRQLDIFVPRNKKYAILEDDIQSIIDDDAGNLWLSTNNKIIQLNLSTGTTILFSSNDNIRTSSFRPGAFLKSSSGQLYFGGGNGFSWFSPDIEKPQVKGNLITITDIEIHNKSIFSDFNPSIFNDKTHTLYLNYNQRNIGIEFSALNYNSPYTVNYAYRLKGVDKDWVYVDSKRRYVNYQNLGRGHYVFEVKSTDENGLWIDQTATLSLIVSPAPYETWWAYLIYALSLITISLLIYRTILNRIRLRRDLLITRIKQEKSEELTQIKLRYFTNVSHELLTPLTIISCLIDDFNHNFPDNFKQYSIMKSNIIRLKRLLQQILDFRKMESGNMKLSVKESDLMVSIRNICENNFEPLVKQKNIEFSIHGPEHLHACFDADKLDKILFNLLSNAFKYTQKNGAINLTIQSEVKNNIQYVKIFVNDTGSGIEPEKLPYIFDRFFGSNDGGESNGIGLSLTKDLVEIHKGSIDVESQVGRGTTFVVEIPVERDFYDTIDFVQQSTSAVTPDIEINSTEIQAIPESTQQLRDNSITLLVVEDNVDLLMIIATALARYFRVITAQNGVEAIKVMQESDVDIVVSDVMMPEMDGLTFCRTLKENVDFSHIPVLLLTAKNQVEDRIACYNAGASAYVAKPFEMDVLIARIKSLIINRQKKNEAFKSALTITPKGYEAGSIDAIFLQEALKVVEDNLDNFDFTHDQLFDALNASKSTVYRKIKSLTGFSPSEFIRNVRLKHACLMLKTGTGNISEIAYAAGFNDPKYFSTCFKNEFGMSPREFIRDHKESALEE